ncbi:polysaccharide pyruvyl transferase family protein, partial [bacterium]|nr:polysaccharide pyruvyl transferase family protein [bacterium]
MMKIGILTLHRPANFGANLQAYSTYRYLLRRGCEVKVIDYVRDRDCLYRSVIPAVQMQAHTHFVET